MISESRSSHEMINLKDGHCNDWEQEIQMRLPIGFFS